MKTLTKDQIQGLTTEQQETLGHLELQRFQVRQKLLDTARHYRGQQWLPAVLPGVFMLVTIGWILTKWMPVCVIGFAFGLWFWAQFQASGVNKRLDALVELLESDRKKRDEESTESDAAKLS